MPAPSSTPAADAVERLRTSALALAGANAVAGGRCAFNPLAVSQRTMVHLAWPRAPAVRDGRGARFPAQVDGDGLLVGLPLGALESMALEPHPEPVAGCHWEVSSAVLDNGRTRVEFDHAGRIARWCVDGAFAALNAPIGPEWDAADIAVIESGPVRARVRVSRADAWIDYILHAHDEAVRVAASAGDALVVALRQAERLVGGGFGPGETITSAGGDGGHWRHWPHWPHWPQWCAMARADGTPLASVACGGRMQLGGEASAVMLRSTDVIALRLPSRRGPSPAVSALSLAVGPAIAVDRPHPALARLIDGDAMLPWCASRADDGAFALTLIESAGSAGRAVLYPTAGVRAGWRVDAAGASRGDLRLTAEGDGIELDHLAGETLLVRWR